MDAGIATEDNLSRIKERGYNYLCVSRHRLTDYQLSDDMQSVTVQQKGYTSHWTEIVRVMKTQKAVTTEATNALGEKVHLRMCSELNKAADNIYGLLNYKKMPFRRIKIERKSL